MIRGVIAHQMWCAADLQSNAGATRVFKNTGGTGWTNRAARAWSEPSRIPEFLTFMRGTLLGKTNPKKARTDKYAKKTDHTRNYVQHARWQFHRLLELLINDPYAPNHLYCITDGRPQLRDALRKAEVAGLTREQLWAKRDEYVASLEAGDAPYSSKLYGSYWIESPNKEQLIVSFKN